MLEKLLGSKLRANALAWLFSRPDERFFVRQLASVLDEDATNLGRELARLADLGILRCATEGRRKYYQANGDCAVFPELERLVVKTAGLRDVLRSALRGIRERIEVAFVHGSFARGQQRFDSDVDLLVVGSVSFGELVSALAVAQTQLGREITPTVYPRAEYRRKVASDDHFLTSVLKGPRVFVVGDQHDLGRLAEQSLADPT